MENNQDWKQLERWQAQREEKIKEEYGIDITKIQGNKKLIDKVTRVMEKILNFLLFLVTAAQVCIVILLFYMLIAQYIEINNLIKDGATLFFLK